MITISTAHPNISSPNGANNLSDALTADRHFVQAGFRALMLGSL
jgi:hypothetical protein